MNSTPSKKVINKGSGLSIYNDEIFVTFAITITETMLKARTTLRQINISLYQATILTPMQNLFLLNNE